MHPAFNILFKKNSSQFNLGFLLDVSNSVDIYKKFYKSKIKESCYICIPRLLYYYFTFCTGPNKTCLQKCESTCTSEYHKKGLNFYEEKSWDKTWMIYSRQFGNITRKRWERMIYTVRLKAVIFQRNSQGDREIAKVRSFQIIIEHNVQLFSSFLNIEWKY